MKSEELKSDNNKIFCRNVFFSFTNIKCKYFIQIKKREIEPKWDKASISKIYIEKKETEKTKETRIFKYIFKFSNIDKNETKAKKLINNKNILKVWAIK